MTKLTDKWFQDIQASPLISDLTDSDDETVELNMRVGSREGEERTCDIILTVITITI